MGSEFCIRDSLLIVQKYDKNAGMGTIFSAMIPYTIGYFVVLAVLVVVWRQ
ncbi:AbgT family transporter [Clostridioides difficile]|uniref:AbgT family transporter n=1 Tax=Clostridioides difficile TaxID=1496 RepID=UPI001EEF7438|nr:AbgT family transporter [Clostridioides difficile]